MKTPKNTSHFERRTTIACFLIVILLSACTPYDGPRAQGAADENKAAGSDTGRNVSVPPRSDEFTDFEGMLVYTGNEEALNENSRLITIYDEDGAPWKVIERDDDSLASLTGEEGDFFPSFFSNGANREFGIELRAVARSEGWIRVVVHETRTPPLKKYVRRDDPLFRLLTWEEWVKEHFNIRFDRASNPVLDTPDGEKKRVSIPDEPLIKADEVRGDWVLIRWTKHEPNEPRVEQIAEEFPGNSGWIRWRKDGKIVIEEYYP